MNEKKYTKKDLYISFVLVAISFLLLLGATIAWFAMNKDVESSNIEIKLNVSPSLVMGSDPLDIHHDSIVYDGNTNFNDELPYYLKPATHDDIGYEDDGSGTGLKYNTNPTAVNYITGLKESTGAALQFQAVPVYGPETAGRRYYIDYEAYISSDVKEMDVSAFNARLGLLSTAGPDYFNSASVDFYVNGTTEGAFRGTLNLAGKDSSGNTKDVLDLTGKTTIPFVDSGHYIYVLMRFYFDGALEKQPGQAYVYSNNLSVQDFHIGVLFDAVEIKDDEPEAGL